MPGVVDAASRPADASVLSDSLINSSQGRPMSVSRDSSRMRADSDAIEATRCESFSVSCRSATPASSDSVIV